MEMKTCYRCKDELPCTNDYFAKDKTTKTGLTSWCKTCINQYVRERYKPNKKTNVDYKKRSANTIEIPKEINVVPIPKINMIVGHCYSIQTPKQNKEVVGQLIKGTVIQVTDKHITVQTKNYKVSFSLWELSKYKIVEV